MPEIRVPPEEIMRVAQQCLNGRHEMDRIIQLLDKEIYHLRSVWSGATREHFFTTFRDAQYQMNQMLDRLSNTGQELANISRRFKEADASSEGSNFGEFLSGAGLATVKDLTFGLMDKDMTSIHPKSRAWGELFGHGVTTALGTVEMIGGILGDGASLALDVTGIGAIVGVPVGVVSLGLISHGYLTAKGGVQGALNSGRDLYQMHGSKSNESAGSGKGGSEKVEGEGNIPVKDTGDLAKNTDNLRVWAKNNGWEQKYTEGGVEQWGVKDSKGAFSWRLKLKPEVSTREGLGSGSKQPRFDARLNDEGTYVNPFTGETGSKGIGTHIPLGK
ncbi:WXG100 family type VII secretion target [Paenibacillus pini]|uniref:WXG100 family type VII secretion target n=1 Tax=Paenibacillus pini JCM 16418 TaxID=1236976 RepID=W7YQ11_9BACL|nr:WXG100 family type VII secretion target [Paenibacillus pini]GAF09568.1 hypothetical protein JCM16418_3712 [Paenibacillus pini JCM 16418]